MAVKFTLGKKIVFGIVLMLMLMIVVGLVGYFGLTGVVGVSELSTKVLKLDSTVAAAGAQTDRYLLSVYSGDKPLGEASVKEVLQELESASKIIQETKKPSLHRRGRGGETEPGH